MALNCDIKEQIFTYNGRDYSYNEFRALMYDGSIDSDLLSEAGVTSPAPSAIETTTETMTLFRGQDGIYSASGERVNAHEGAKGLFASTDESAAAKYGKKTGVKTIEIPPGATVETIALSGSVDDLRQREIDAINASSADIIRLETIDQGKSAKQVQYVIKNKAFWPEPPSEATSETPPPPPPKQATPKEEKPEPAKGEREAIKKLLQKHPELKSVVSEDIVNYEKISVSATKAQADAIVEAEGPDAALLKVADESNSISSPVRTLLAAAIADAYAKEGRYDKINDALRTLANKSTESAQTLSAMRAIYQEMPTPAHLYNTKKSIDQQRDARKESDMAYKRTLAGFKKIQKEASEQVAKTTRIRNKVAKVAAGDQAIDPMPENPSQESLKQKISERIKDGLAWKNNKVIKKERKAEILKQLRTLNTGPNPLMVELIAGYLESGVTTFSLIAKDVSKHLGRKALPYLKDAYKAAFKYAKDNGVEVSGDQTSEEEIDEFLTKVSADKLVGDLKKALFANNRAEVSRIIDELQSLAKGYDAWGVFAEWSAKRLSQMAEASIKKDIAERSEVEEFSRGLVRNISAQLREKAEAEGRDPEKIKVKSDIEIIVDAYKNFDRYKEVWEKTQNDFKAKRRAAVARLEKAEKEGNKEAADKARADIAREDAKLEALDSYYGDLMVKPFSDKAMGRAVKQAMKDLGLKIEEIIKSHYNDQESAKKRLAERLVAEAGLSPEQAADLEKAIIEEFNKIAEPKKRALMAKALAGPKAPIKRPASLPKEAMEAIELTNSGAFTEEQFIEAYGKAKGWPEFTPEIAAEVVRLAERMQKAPVGRPKNEALEDLLRYQAKVKGILFTDLIEAQWYASLLSSIDTQEVNIQSGFRKMLQTYLESITTNNPNEWPNITKAMVQGIVQKGLLESMSVLATGYSPVRGAIEMPSAAEVFNYKKISFPAWFPVIGGKNLNPYSWAPIVGRMLKAFDTIWFEGGKEIMAYKYAAYVAKERGEFNTTAKKFKELMNQSDKTVLAARSQADQEYQEEFELLLRQYGSEEKIPRKIREKAIRDRKRRVFELVEMGRDEKGREIALKAARKNVWAQDPTGVMGMFVRVITQITNYLPPAKGFIPFARLLGNLANDLLDYYPISGVGLGRAILGAESITEELKRRKAGKPREESDFEIQEIRKQKIARLIMGMTTMFLLYLMTHTDDDEEESWITITANGHNDYRKNQMMEENGTWAPYSFKLKGSDTWISYKTSPLLLAMALIGHIRDTEKYRKEKISDEFYTKWAVAAQRNMQSFTEMHFIGGFKDMLNAMAGEGSGDWLKKADAFIERQAAAVAIPLFGLYAQILRTYDAAFDTPKKDVKGVLGGEFIKNIPFARDAYHPMINYWGEEIMPKSGAFGRFATSSSQDPSRIEELLTNTPEPSKFDILLADKGYYPERPSPNEIELMGPDGEPVLADRHQRYVYYLNRGAFIKQRVESAYESIKDLDQEKFENKMKEYEESANAAAKSFVSGIKWDGKGKPPMMPGYEPKPDIEWP